MMSRARIASFTFAAWLLASVALPGPLDGRWEGAVRIAGQELRIAVMLRSTEKGPEAAIDIPQQGAAGLRLTNVTVTPERVHFELPAGPGVAVFDGTHEQGTIAGAFRQGGVEGTFEMRLAAPKVEDAPPYVSEDVSVKSGDATLACTLTRPDAAGRFPAVLLLTGSGAQNRDEELFGFKPFRLIADDLTRRGVAVLRCDDRGVGGSTPPAAMATSKDAAEDALAGVRFLRARGDVEPRKVGLLGHSSGGTEAILAAAQAQDLAFVVLLAGPTVRGDALVRTQLEAIARAEGQSEVATREALVQQEVVFKAARTGEQMDEVMAAVRRQVLAQIEALPEAQRKTIANPAERAEAAARGQAAVLRSAWYRFMLDYDPAADLARLDCPVLAIFGERDLQVDAEANRKAFEAALASAGRKRGKTLVIAGANHLFQPGAKTGSPSEYATLPKEFAPGVLEAIGSFVVLATR